MSTLDLDTLTPAQRENRARRLAHVERFVEQDPGATPRGPLGEMGRAEYKALPVEERRAHLTRAVDREVAAHLAEVAAKREAWRAARPEAPRFRPEPAPEAVAVGGSVTGGRTADEPAPEPGKRKGKRAASPSYAPGQPVGRCVGCGEFVAARAGRPRVLRCSPRVAKRNGKPTPRATCGRYLGPAPVPA